MLFAMLKNLLIAAVLGVFAMMLNGCNAASKGERGDRFAIVIHGGAGVLSKTAPPADVAAYEASLARALSKGRDHLASGGTSLDAVELVVRELEDNPLFNAGKGAVFTAEGKHELDASIMNGSNLACGAIAGVTTVKNPISLARLVMQNTKHVLLAAAGAERFATEQKVERVENSYFDTERRRKSFEEWKNEQASTVPGYTYGTVGCVALDKKGNLAAATSTGGMTGKRWGRVGDAPIVGAGTYANNESCAISCTGTGEEFIRHGVARAISDRMLLAGESLKTASDHLVFKTLKTDDGGLIGVSKTGKMVMPYNSEGMFRGMADSSGRFEIGIWGEVKTVKP